jgi:hypothetical protein
VTNLAVGEGPPRGWFASFFEHADYIVTELHLLYGGVLIILYHRRWLAPAVCSVSG